MELMDKDTKEHVKEALGEMKGPVHVMVFTAEDGCMACKETLSIVEEISALSERITVKHLDMEKDRKLAEKYGVDKTPAIVIMRGTEQKYEYLGIRFFGIPAGYEFTSLLDAILTVSKGSIGISEEGQKFLRGLTKDIHIQVFVTPTCPYCPSSVVLAHHMALVSEKVTADMVEAQEFPELSQKFNVMGVPRTVINDKYHQEGAAPERLIIQLLQKVQNE
ncbi:MAG: thioredoxin family protein [Candidatus Thermoplasmatota archaeon]|nr:thioredoxin family protein [Candidatus Thermoplasmatota archaeon]